MYNFPSTKMHTYFHIIWTAYFTHLHNDTSKLFHHLTETTLLKLIPSYSSQPMRRRWLDEKMKSKIADTEPRACEWVFKSSFDVMLLHTIPASDAARASTTQRSMCSYTMRTCETDYCQSERAGKLVFLFCYFFPFEFFSRNPKTTKLDLCGGRCMAPHITNKNNNRQRVHIVWLDVDVDEMISVRG